MSQKEASSMSRNAEVEQFQWNREGSDGLPSPVALYCSGRGRRRVVLHPDEETGRWSGGGRSRKTCAVPICGRACDRAVFRR